MNKIRCASFFYIWTLFKNLLFFTLLSVLKFQLILKPITLTNKNDNAVLLIKKVFFFRLKLNCNCFMLINRHINFLVFRLLSANPLKTATSLVVTQREVRCGFQNILLQFYFHDLVVLSTLNMNIHIYTPYYFVAFHLYSFNLTIQQN